MADEPLKTAVLTNVGIAKLDAAYQSGNKITIAEMAIGDANMQKVEADPAFTQLVNEFGRQPINEGNTSETWINAIVYVDNERFAGKSILEFGLYDDEGDLIVYSSYTPSVVPSVGQDYIQLEIECSVDLYNASAVTIEVTPIYPQATELERGIAKIATDEDTKSGEDDEKIVTPKKLSSVLTSKLDKNQNGADIPDKDKFIENIGAQKLNALLTSLSNLTTSANKIPYFTGKDTVEQSSLTPFARTLLDDVSAETALKTLNAQAASGVLSALSGLNPSANKIPLFTSANAASLTDISDVGRDIIKQATKEAVLEYLGLGDAATKSYVDSKLSENGEIYQGANSFETSYPIGHILTVIFNGIMQNKLNSNNVLYTSIDVSVGVVDSTANQGLRVDPINGTWKFIGRGGALGSSPTALYQRVL